ncbi:MAG: ECF transporter S component [Mycoplasmatales bacterium]
MNSNKKIVYFGLLAALGVIINLIEIPYPLVPYLKIDLSEIVVLIATLISIPGAIIVGLVKALLHFQITGAIPIGEISLFVGSLTMALSFGLSKKKLSLIPSLIISIMTFSVIMVTMNYFVVYPVFANTPLSVLQEDPTYFTTIVVTYLPFNLIKSSLITFIFYLLNKGFIGKYFNDKM